MSLNAVKMYVNRECLLWIRAPKEYAGKVTHILPPFVGLADRIRMRIYRQEVTLPGPSPQDWAGSLIWQLTEEVRHS
jgi:hypothetical protein